MSETPGTVYVPVKPDTTGFQRTLSSRINTALAATGARMRTAGRTMSLGLTVPIIAGLGKAMDSAADLGESLNKTKVVFGQQARAIIRWSKDSATAIGLSRTSALDAAGGYGAMFIALGLNEKASGKMSMSLVKLAADMASLHNQDPTEMLDKIRAGMSGEMEPLKRFGIVLSETEVGLHAVKEGIAQEGEEMTNQQKIQARYSLLMQQAATSQGDFARTAESLPNQQRILRAQLENTAASIGERLIPIGLKLATMFNKVLDWLDKLTPAQEKWVLIIAGLVAALGPLVYILGALATAIGFIVSPIGLVVVAIGALVAGLVYAYKHSEAFRDFVTKAWRFIQAVAQEVWPYIKGVIAAAMDFIKAVIERTVTIVTYIWKNYGDVIMDTARSVWEKVKAIIKGGLQVLQGIFKFFGALFKGDWKGVWNALKQIVFGATKVINSIIAGAWAVIKGIFVAAGRALAALWSKIWQDIKAKASAGWALILAYLSNVPQRILNIFKGAGEWLMDIGRDVMRGLWNGLKEVWADIQEWFSGITSWISENKGPLRVDRHLLTPHGEAIMEGFNDGLRKKFGSIKGSIVEVGRMLQSMGATVSEHPAFGGVGTHSVGSMHYSGRAIDVNFAPGESAAEKAKLNALAAWLRETLGGRIAELIYPATGDPAHQDHLHLAMAKGGIVTQPTHALIGEAGAEAVVPLAKLPELLREAGAGGDGGVTVPVKVQGNIIGIEDLAKQLIKALSERRELGLMGRS